MSLSLPNASVHASWLCSLLFLYAAHPTAAAQSCGATITSNLTLTADLDLTGCTGTALSVGADGITIDGQGHTVLAPDASAVFGLAGRSGVSIVNVVIPGNGSGIGVLINGGTNNSVQGCTISGRSHGVFLGNNPCNANTIQGNDLSGNGYAVHGASAGQGNRILSNDLSSSSTFAISFESDNSLEIAGNIYTGSTNGIHLGAVSGITLVGADLSQVSGTALQLGSVSSSTFTGIQAHGAEIATLLQFCNDNVISNLQAAGNGSHIGVMINGGTNNWVQGCTISGRTYGVTLGNNPCNANTIQGNDLAGNGYAVHGASAGQGNRILSNDLSSSSTFAISFESDNSLEIAGNTYTGSTNGIHLGAVSGITLVGADLSQVSGTALHLGSVSSSTFTGIQAHGAELATLLQFCNDNVISNLQAAGSGSQFGVMINGGTNNSVQGCTISGRTYGVFLGNNPCNANTIQGNDLSGNGFAVHGGSAGQGNRILNNDLSASSAYAISFESDNALEIAGNTYTGSANGIALGAVSGLTLVGADLSQVSGTALQLGSVSSSTFTGILAHGAEIATLLQFCNDNVISNLQAAGSGSQFGVMINGGTNNSVQGCTISGRTYGVFLGNNPCNANTIQGNDLSGNGYAVHGGSAGQGNRILNNDLSASTAYAISFDSDNALEIAGNIYTGSANGIALGAVDGLSLSGADLREVSGTGLDLGSVSNSTFTDIFAAADTVGVRLSGGGGNLFAGIEASSTNPFPTGAGFQINGSSNNTIENSTVGMRVTGIFLHGSSNLVRCCVVTQNTVGVSVSAAYGGNVLRQNKIAQNVIGVDGGTLVDAENNYWGTLDGPAPSGAGNPIVGVVDADPFFADLATLLAACPGVVNSPPTAACSGGGTYQLGLDTVTLQGSVSDLEGELVTFEWREGGDLYASGSVLTSAGGSPVSLPAVPLVTGVVHDPLLGVIGPGSHTITLTVSDGSNTPVDCVIQVEVVDTQVPTLAPGCAPSTLWPPSHQMVEVVICANAFDNSGGAITLTATVASSEPEDAPGLGDGNTAPDFTEPVISQEDGTITVQLRAERAAKGPGRTYTVTITATDEFGNAATAVAVFHVPHDQG